MHFTIWDTVILFIFAVILLVLLMYRQARRFKIRYIKVNSAKNKDDKQKIKFMHLSDIHIGRLYIKTEDIINVIRKEKPLFIALTGDYCEKESEIPLFIDFISKLSKVAPQIPFYFTFGNHEVKDIFSKRADARQSFVDLIEDVSENMHVLENDFSTLQTSQGKYIIGGLDDSRSNMGNIPEIVSRWRKPGIPLILLCHNADITYKLEPGSADLLLCGHTHGGQIWLPFKLEFYIFHKDKTPKKGLIHGEHIYKGIPIYINSGLGCTSLSLRLFSISEIVIIEI